MNARAGSEQEKGRLGQHLTELRSCKFHSVQFFPDACLVRSATGTFSMDRTAAALLTVLLENCGELVSKDDLIETGWSGRIVHENSLAKAIGRVRDALGKEKHLLETVFGLGYKLVGEAKWEQAPHPAAKRPAAKIPTRESSPLKRLRNAFKSRPAAIYGIILGLLGCFTLYFAWEHWPARASADRNAEADALVAYISGELISSSDPYAPEKFDPDFRAVVDKLSMSIDTRFADFPSSLVPLHLKMAEAVSGWGEYGRAVKHLDAAREYAETHLPPLDPIFVRIDTDLCQQLRLAGRTKRGSRICQRAVSGAEARDPERMSKARVYRAKMAFETGDYVAARDELRKAVDRPDGLAPHLLADAHWFLGLSERKLAHFPAAETAFRTHIEMRAEQVGDDHPLTAWAYSDYGDFLIDAGRTDEAVVELQKAQKIFDARLGADHIESLSPQYSLALVHLAQRNFDQARAMLNTILPIYQHQLGADHFWTLYTKTELAALEAKIGQTDNAAKLMIEAQRDGEAALYGRPAKQSWFYLRWTETLVEAKHDEAAQTQLKLAQSALRDSFGTDHPWYARSLCLEARLALRKQKRPLAAKKADSCLKILQQSEISQSYPLLADARRLVKDTTAN